SRVREIENQSVYAPKCSLALVLKRCSLGRFAAVERMPIVVQLCVQAFKQKRFESTVVDFAVKLFEVDFVAAMLVAHIKHHEPARLDACRHDPFVVCSHDDVKTVLDGERIHVLWFDHQRVFGDQTFQWSFSLFISCPKSLVYEKENALHQVRVEVTS